MGTLVGVLNWCLNPERTISLIKETNSFTIHQVNSIDYILNLDHIQKSFLCQSSIKWSWHHFLFSGKQTKLKQSAGKVITLPPETRCFGMFVQMAGLAKPFPTFQAGIGFLSGMHTDVLLAVC